MHTTFIISNTQNTFIVLSYKSFERISNVKPVHFLADLTFYFSPEAPFQQLKRRI